MAGLLTLAVVAWGASNAGTKYLVGPAGWPPVWTGGTRFFCAGLLLLGWLQLTGTRTLPRPLGRQTSRELWLRGGLSLAAYIIVFNWALRLTSASHVALYLGAAPVWALLWEGRPADARPALARYAAAALALSGVVVLLWPALRGAQAGLAGEALGLAASLLWTSYGRQCRVLTREMGGVEVSAHTMWRAGLLLLPLALVELSVAPLPGGAREWGVQTYCVLGGGVLAYAIWSAGLRRWPTSRVYLFNNLIPLSTMAWAHFTLGEPVTPTFWTAMVLIVAGVLLGQRSRPQLPASPS